MTILLALVLAQEDLRVLDPDAAPDKMLRASLLAECGRHFEARRRAVAALRGPEDVARRAGDLRAKFVHALGGFPEKTPLRARVVAKEERDGYRVEKVVYESRPGHHVSALLYLPSGAGPFPGVVMPMGHSITGKAADYAQRGSILLAKNGIACLNYDPIGQGERLQLLTPQGKSPFRGSTAEHTQIGSLALLVGWSAATFRIWDGIRSLDYLGERPEIDPARLGATGCSGGGTLSSYLMALDERVLAAAPSCYITSLERLFATIGPQDAEQNIPGQVAFGLDHADYLLLRAPKPTLLLTGTRDFFDIQGSRNTFEEARGVYAKLGRPEAVEHAEFDIPHGYPKEHRQAAVRWMRRWLLDRNDEVVEGEFPIAKDADTWCVPTGQVLSALKGASAFDLIARRAEELSASRGPLTPGKVAAALRLTDGAEEVFKRPSAEPLQGPRLKRNAYEIVKVSFKIEPGITLPGLLFIPPGTEPTPSVLYLHGEGKSKDLGAIEDLVKGGQVVLSLDLRGAGELAGHEFQEAFLSMHLDRPLLGQRVNDVLRVLRAYDGAMEIVGVGKAAPVALHAAYFDRRIRKLTLEDGACSWTSIARTPLAKDHLANVVPGVLREYDFPELVAALRVPSVVIRQTRDPAGAPLSQTALEAMHRPSPALTLIGAR